MLAELPVVVGPMVTSSMPAGVHQLEVTSDVQGIQETLQVSVASEADPVAAPGIAKVLGCPKEILVCSCLLADTGSPLVGASVVLGAERAVALRTLVHPGHFGLLEPL